MDPDPPVQVAPQPSVWRWVVGFLLVGAAWGLTTPFMRKAAVQKDEEQQQTPPGREFLSDPSTGWMKRKFWTLVYAVIDLLRRPAYAIPLVINLTGSVWFFLLIGQAGTSMHAGSRISPSCHTNYFPGRSSTDLCVPEISLMVPVTNSLAFMFTVLGEWFAEKKVISRGMCDHSKTYHTVVDKGRYLDWDGSGAWWNRSLCSLKEFVTSAFEQI